MEQEISATMNTVDQYCIYFSVTLHDDSIMFIKNCIIYQRPKVNY